MNIEVYRGDGARRGADIQEPLLGTSLQAALARGRAELNAQAHRWQQVELLLPYRNDLALGDLLSVTDAYAVESPTWVGRVIGISHQISPDAMLTTLTVARPDV
jgi:hypothetical protein